MSEDILKRLGAVEAKLDRVITLLSQQPRSSASGAGASAGGGSVEPLADHQLDNAWADKEIRKDPPRYIGPSMVGRRYSEATAEWLTAQSGFMAWKAGKGREENPVRMNAKGKPWHESDTFESRICAAWAIRNANKGTASAHAATDDFGGPVNGSGAGGFEEDELPFATCANASEKTPRWERW